jgi:thiol-disulfide isomerase/thioredoxin
MKKTISSRAAAILAVLILCLALLVGCGGKAQSPAETPAEPAVTPARQEETPAEQPDNTSADQPAEPPAATPGENFAPDILFTTVDMGGNTWTEACFAEHKLTMLNLWAYWCGPCVGEMPDLQKLSEEYADAGLQIIGLYDESDEAEDRETLAQLGVTYPCLRYTSSFDPYMDTGYIPVTIFVDSDGKVLSTEGGSRSYAEWAEILDGYLK